MFFRRSGWIAGGLALALACGCASQKASAGRDNESYTQLRQRELDSERREFISERQKQLTELQTQISRLEARLEHEGKFASAEERAKWSQRLFELREDQRRARDELDRAERASPEEWAAMRGNLGVMIDSLQAGVSKAGSDIARLFESDDQKAGTSSAAPEVGLCSLQVKGTDAAILEERDNLVVQVTARNEDNVDELRQRAEKLSERTTSARNRHASAAAPDHDVSSAEQHAPLMTNVRVENIEDGVRLIFTPAQGQRSALRARLELEVEQIQHAHC